MEQVEAEITHQAVLLVDVYFMLMGYFLRFALDTHYAMKKVKAKKRKFNWHIYRDEHQESWIMSLIAAVVLLFVAPSGYVFLVENVLKTIPHGEAVWNEFLSFFVAFFAYDLLNLFYSKGKSKLRDYEKE